MENSLGSRAFIYAHRGLWVNEAEQNSQMAIRKALDLGFSVETDIVEVEGKVYISHDASNLHEAALFDQVNLNGSMALNLKSDGAWVPLIESKKQLLDSGSFFFDGSGPVMHQICKNGLPAANRISENEPEPSFGASYLWVDSFSGTVWWTREQIERWVTRYKRLIFVSPELHRQNHLNVWVEVRDAIKKYSGDRVAICTDFPFEFLTIIEEK